MLKRIIAFGLAIAMALFAGPIQAYAMESINTGLVIVDEDVHNQIESLMNLRCRLCLDFENNAQQIEKIDVQLAQLGVEEISWDDMAKKLRCSDVSPMVTPAPKSGVQFFSERFITVYNGERYEIQVVTSSPKKNVSGPLKQTDTLMFEATEKMRADNIEFLKTAVVGAASVGSLFGENSTMSAVLGRVSTASSLIDVLHAFNEAISSYTYVEGVYAAAFLNINTYEKHVFVKPEGAVDEGNQILAYCGTSVIYTATVNFVDDTEVDGIIIPDNESIKITEDFYSEYYNNYTQRVAQIYWNYKRGIDDFTQYFLIRKIDFTAIGADSVSKSITYVGAVWD